MKICTVDEMRHWEQQTIAGGVTVEELMKRAGMELARCIRQHLRFREPVVVCAGPGNNGGDALIAAGALHEAGCAVRVILFRRQYEDTPGPSENIPFLEASAETLTECTRWMEEAGTIVDGLLGTGRSRAPAEVLLELIRLINRTRKKNPSCFVVAADLPSGSHPDTGAIEAAAVEADLTVAFGSIKAGTLCFPTVAQAGDIRVVDIGLVESAAPHGEAVESSAIAQVLPVHSRDSNKGTHGTLLIIGGSDLYIGAPALAARAATRVGAGLVTIATPHVAYPLVATRALEATFQLLPDVEGAVSLAANDVVIPFLDRVQSVVIGPGLSQRPGVSAFIRTFLKTCRSREHIPLVIDADALNVLSTQEEWWTLVPPGCVLTPHPGEMARLTGRSVREIQAARVDIARTAAAHWCQTVVLKGAHTIVATPNGRWSMILVATPTLAIAGAGDVLAGIIGGLLAQGLEPYTAAVVGASVHGYAGLLLEGRIGLAGATPDDVVGVIPEVMTRLQSNRWPSKKIACAS